MPGKEHEARPLIKKMFLMAFRLSGNSLKCSEFLRGLGTSSYNFGDCIFPLEQQLALKLNSNFNFLVSGTIQNEGARSNILPL